MFGFKNVVSTITQCLAMLGSFMDDFSLQVMALLQQTRHHQYRIVIKKNSSIFNCNCMLSVLCTAVLGKFNHFEDILDWHIFLKSGKEYIVLLTKRCNGIGVTK